MSNIIFTTLVIEEIKKVIQQPDLMSIMEKHDLSWYRFNKYVIEAINQLEKDGAEILNYDAKKWKNKLNSKVVKVKKVKKTRLELLKNIEI